MSKAKIVKNAGKVVGEIAKGVAYSVVGSVISKRLDPDKPEKKLEKK